MTKDSTVSSDDTYLIDVRFETRVARSQRVIDVRPAHPDAVPD